MHFVYYAIGPLAAISAIHLKRIAYFVAHLCSSSSTYFLVVLGCNPKECPHKYTHGSSGFTSFKSAIKINTFFLYLLYLHGVQIRVYPSRQSKSTEDKLGNIAVFQIL